MATSLLYSYLEPAVNRQPGFRRGAVEQTRPPSAKEQTEAPEPTKNPTDHAAYCYLIWWLGARWLGGLVASWLGGVVV